MPQDSALGPVQDDFGQAVREVGKKKNLRTPFAANVCCVFPINPLGASPLPFHGKAAEQSRVKMFARVIEADCWRMLADSETAAPPPRQRQAISPVEWDTEDRKEAA